MRTLADQAQVVAELQEIRGELNRSLINTRNLIGRVDKLMGYYAGIPRSRLTVAPDLVSEAPEDAPEPSEEPQEPQETREERPYSVSRLFGKMFYEDIARKASVMGGSFTGTEFRTTMGLGTGDAMMWLTKLVADDVLRFAAGRYEAAKDPTLHMWVINHPAEMFDVERAAEVTRQAPEDVQEEIDDLLDRKIISTVNGGGVYQYVKPGTHLSPNHHPHRAPPEKDPPCYGDAPPRGEPVRIRKDTRRSRSVSGAGGIKGPKQRNARYQQQQEAQAARSAEQSAKDKARYGGSGDKNNSRKAKRKASTPA